LADKEKELGRLRNLISTAFSKLEEQEARFAKCEAAYRAKEPDADSSNTKKKKANNTDSRIFIPLIKSTVQIMHSIFQTSFMNKKCPIVIDRVGYRTPHDLILRNTLAVLVKNKWEKSTHRRGLSKAALSAISLPLGCVALFWDNDKNDICSRFVPITNIAFDPEAPDFDSIEYVCCKNKVTLREVLDGIKSGLYDTEDSQSFEDSEDMERRYKKEEIYVKSYANGKDIWTLTTFIEGKVARDGIVFGDLPFHFGYILDDLPSINIDKRDEEPQIYGLSVCEILYELQKEYNIKRNQKIDVVDMMLKPARVININAGAAAVQDITERRPYIRVKPDMGQRVEDVIKIDYQPSPYPIEAEIAMLKEEYEETSGVNSIMMGRTSPADRRAMGALQTVNASSSLRIESMMQTFADTMLNGYARHFVKLVYENASDEEFIAVTENPEVINIIGTKGQRAPIDFDVEINFGTVIADEVKLGRLQQLLQMLLQTPNTNPAVVTDITQEIMTIIQGENAAIESVILLPPPPSEGAEAEQAPPPNEDLDALVNGEI
jgi:hypothetical protein